MGGIMWWDVGTPLGEFFVLATLSCVWEALVVLVLVY